jgi:hypothetical protein
VTSLQHLASSNLGHRHEGAYDLIRNHYVTRIRKETKAMKEEVYKNLNRFSPKVCLQHGEYHLS